MDIARIIEKLFWQQISSDYLQAGAMLFVLIFALMLFLNKKFLNSFAVAALCAYLFLIFSVTVFCRTPASASIIRIRPFWSYKRAFIDHNADTRGQILRNCLLLMPAGFLLALCFYPKRIKLRWVLLASAVVSYAIEFLQLILHRGTFELVDDPLDNLIGCAAGYLLAWLLIWLANELIRLYHKRKRSP